ncbi:hypothetical protein DFH07DRAFT_860605 [Mycena maculata]|uniref:Uncharacterized protein n=1 Tax=Mycena maculata TaxID=230809 RepID=A0AAD7HDA2_9AGAR|nr:hypothetical protein DFH07DRAFT_860605 [Mycena maculata]
MARARFLLLGQITRSRLTYTLDEGLFSPSTPKQVRMPERLAITVAGYHCRNFGKKPNALFSSEERPLISLDITDFRVRTIPVRRS